MKFSFTEVSKKFLSKFKIIDWIGIGIFFAILAMATAVFLRRTSFVYVTLEISHGEDAFHNFWFYKPPHWYIQNLQTGMANKDVLGRTDLELVDMYYYPNKSNEYSLYVTLKTRTVFNKRSQQHSYQGQPLLVGEQRVFKLGSVSIPSMIHKIEDYQQDTLIKKAIVSGELKSEDHEEIEIAAETRFLGIRNYLADVIEPGLVIEDSKGKIVAEILDAKKTTGYREFIYQNSLIKVIDPERKNVQLIAELVLNEINGEYLYMEEAQILLGEIVEFPFDDFVLYLTVEKIEYPD